MTTFLKIAGRWCTRSSQVARSATVTPEEERDIPEYNAIDRKSDADHESFIRGRWRHLREIEAMQQMMEKRRREVRRERSAKRAVAA